jgi:hypothetical protein
MCNLIAGHPVQKSLGSVSTHFTVFLHSCCPSRTIDNHYDIPGSSHIKAQLFRVFFRTFVNLLNRLVANFYPSKGLTMPKIT